MVRESNVISMAKLPLLCVDLPLCCWLWAATIQVAVVSCLCVAILVKEVIVTPRATDDSFWPWAPCWQNTNHWGLPCHHQAKPCQQCMSTRGWSLEGKCAPARQPLDDATIVPQLWHKSQYPSYDCLSIWECVLNGFVCAKQEAMEATTKNGFQVDGTFSGCQLRRRFACWGNSAECR